MLFRLKQLFFFTATFLVLVGRGGEYGFCNDKGISSASPSTVCSEERSESHKPCDQSRKAPVSRVCDHGCTETNSAQSSSRALDTVHVIRPNLLFVGLLELPNPFLFDTVGNHNHWINETDPPGGFCPARSQVRLL